MKNKVLVLLIVVLTIHTSLASAAQQAELPRYAVAFGYQRGTRIAILESNGRWRFDDLPSAYFGEGNSQLISTAWSPNVPTAYTVQAAPEDGQYRYIYAYDLITRKQAPVVLLDKARSSDYPVILVSPDGRYLWIERVGDDSSRLIDIQAAPDKRVLARIDECPAELLVWLRGKVLVTGFDGCAYTNYLFDLKTGKTAFSYLQNQDETHLTFGGTVIVPTGDQSFVLVYVGDEYTLSKLSLQTGRPEKWLDVTWLSVSGDQKSAAFVSAGHVYALDLRTLATADLGAIGPVESSFATENTVNFWTVGGQNTPQTIQRVTVQVQRRADSTVYNARAFQHVSFAPEGQGFMLDFGQKGDYQLYNAEGQQTWHSLKADPRIAAQLNFNLETDTWTGAWYLGRVNSTTTAEGAVPRSFAVNATTGITVLAPEQAPVWESAAPDQVWWLYASPYCDDPQSSKLIAYDIETSQTVTMAEGGVLHSCGAGFPDASLYAWSPIFQAGQ